MYFNTYEVYIIYNYKSENNNYIAGSSTYKNLLKRYQPSSSSSYPSVVVQYYSIPHAGCWISNRLYGTSLSCTIVPVIISDYEVGLMSLELFFCWSTSHDHRMKNVLCLSADISPSIPSPSSVVSLVFWSRTVHFWCFRPPWLPSQRRRLTVRRKPRSRKTVVHTSGSGFAYRKRVSC